MKPTCNAMKVARDALTTDAQALIPQAHGTRAGARAPSALSPSGKGHAQEKTDGPEQRERHDDARGDRPPLRGLEDPGQESEVGPADGDDAGRGEGDWRPAPCQTTEPVNRAGAKTGEDQKAGKHHRDGVKRMPEKDREALHERDLDEEEGQAEAREEHCDTPAGGGLRRRTQRSAGRGARAAARRIRSAAAIAPCTRVATRMTKPHSTSGRPPCARKRQEFRERRPLQTVEEERPVVGRGSERELVAGSVSLQGRGREWRQHPDRIPARRAC